MKKILIGLGVVIVVIVAAVFVVPPLIDWKSFEPRIAKMVLDATGRELHIDGDIEISLVPLEFSVSGIRLSNAPGMRAPEMVTVASVTAKLELLPLLTRSVVVDSFVITEPAIFLEVDETGRPNWEFDLAPAPEEEKGELPISDLRLGDVRIDRGHVSYVDASSGQAVQARDISVKLGLAGLGSPLTVTARMTLNDEPLSLDVSLDSPAAVLSGGRFDVTEALDTKHLKVSFAGAVQQEPVPGLDGTFDLDVGSVGRLAAWLGQPLDPSQPDPGPLKVHAALSADGPKVVIEEATISGTALEARATGSFDGSGEIAKVVLNVESGVLDIDRYLPPPSGAPTRAAQEADEPGEPADPLAALGIEPIDLTPLRQTEAEVNVAIGGIKAMGYEDGRIAYETTLKGGVLAVDLGELALYGGSVKGTVNLDASGEALSAGVAMTVSGVNLGALANAAMGGEAPVAGILSSTVTANATGANPRALVDSLTGKVAVDLGGVDVRDAPVGAISEVNLDLDFPGLANPLSLIGSVVYNKERVNFNVAIDSPKAVLDGDRADVKVAVASRRVNVSYDGAVLQKPVPGLDGTFDLDVGSVGRFAAWLGQPLDPSQPDPGPLKVHAALAADGAKVVIEEATIKGTALDARVSGSFDGGGDIAKVVLNVESGVLDIDRYLPASAAAPPAQEQPDATAGGAGDLLAALPTDPFGLAPLRETEAEVNVAIGGIKAMGFEVGRVALATTLKGGVLTADLSELGLYGGNVKGTVKLDGSTDVLDVGVAMTLSDVNLGALAQAAMAGEAPVAGILSSTVSASGKGANPRALVESLSGNVTVDLGGIDVKDAPVGAISEVKVALDLPGIESPPTLTGSVVYNQERVTLDVTVDPIRTVLAGEKFNLKASLASQLVNASYDGAIQQVPVPGLDGTFDLDVGSVGKLAAWLGQPLDAAQPDPGPLTVHAALAADGAKVVLNEATIKGKAIDALASGSYDGSGAVAQFGANVEIKEANLNAYLPPPTEEATPAQPEPAQQPAAGWSEEPIDFAPLRQANGEIKIVIGTVLYKDLTITNGRITVTLANGVLNAAIDGLQMASGTIGVKATVDASQPAAAVDYQVSVAGVEVRPLLTSFAGTDRLSGKADFQTKGRTKGRSQKEFVETLNGDGSFKFLDGAIHGIDLAATLRQAKTLGFGEGGETTQKTDFAELSRSYFNTNGLLENRDFKMLAPLLRVQGGGTVPLPSQTVDYLAEVKLVATTSGQGGENALAGLPIPVSIKGPWADPSYGVDWQSVFGAAALDPERLANMPDDMLEAAKGFGVDLPFPELPGTEAVGELLKAMPGIGGAGEAAAGTSEPSTTESVVDKVRGLFGSPTPALTTEEPRQEEEPDLPAPLKSLKSLFGN